jgi:ATP-dependent Clp protease ATP-binding subunit ClpX
MNGIDKKCCSFCSKDQLDVEVLVEADQDVLICNECVDLCNSIIDSQNKIKKIDSSKKEPLKPSEIYEKLGEHVIGQIEAKETLAVAVYNHYKRINNQNDIPDNDVEIEKSNILMVGPSGSGKTLIAKTLAKMLDVPFAIADATSLTEAGYVGEDVENILHKLLTEADFDVEKAEQGIIYIDEIDKIGRKTSGTSISRDVSGEGVQQALLKLIEGSVSNVQLSGGKKHPQQETVEINTKNILFICGGAFAHLNEMLDSKHNKKEIGFHSAAIIEAEEVIKKLTTEDIIQYGLIPEFVGRLPIIARLESLDKETLISILTKPKNSICKQFEKMFLLENVELDFTEGSLEALAELAILNGTGARGLRTEIESILKKTMFLIPDMANAIKVQITRENVIDKTEPKIITGKKKIAKKRKKDEQVLKKVVQ